ncbi:MAG: DUF805 domain-containing protein [Terriglobales bacterium]|jgi:uncharacterized membrane protein YhaH (DUF805 family)
MRHDAWQWPFTWEGRVQRLPYFVAGTILVLLKYALDWSVAARFGESWHIWNYFLPALDTSYFALGIRQPRMYAILWAIAVPFFWVGITLTLRRLRDAGKATTWIFLFFVPVANLIMFLWLSLVPEATAAPAKDSGLDKNRKIARPHGAALGLLLAVVLGIGLVALSSRALVEYSWGLFLGVPFLTGFVASWFLNAETSHSRFATIKVVTLSTFLIGLALFGFGMEGLFCLAMAVPLALPFSIAGGLLARDILRTRSQSPSHPTLAACLMVLPLFMFAEHAAKLEPPVLSVTTSITIDAPLSAVWKNVVAFPPLAPPKELLFRAGIAYPTSAQIVGSGPGAIRYCRFSTGDFVEPITVWDENHLLAFDVSAQPQAMREFSPWKISPPHLEHNYMRSLHGQFRLVALSENRTLLEGTTWYQNYFWPQAYWRQWSDGIVHQIHLRVLRHVKQQAEAR